MARSVIGKGLVALGKGAVKVGGKIIKGIKGGGKAILKGLKGTGSKLMKGVKAVGRGIKKVSSKVAEGGRAILTKMGWKPKKFDVSQVKGYGQFPTKNTERLRELLTRTGGKNVVETLPRQPIKSIPTGQPQGFSQLGYKTPKPAPQTGFSYLPPRQDAPLITSKAKNVRKYNKVVKKDVAKKLGKLD